MTFKTRLILIFLVASLVPMLLLQIYIAGRYYRKQKEKITAFITDNLAQKKKNLDQEIEDFQNLILSLMTDPSVMETIHGAIGGDRDGRALLISRLEEILSEATYRKSGLTGILYVNIDEDILVNYNKYLISDDEIFLQFDGIAGAIELIESNNGGITFLPTVLMNDISEISRSIFLLGSRFSDLNRSQWRGYIFLLINENDIHELLNPHRLPDNEIFSYTFLRNRTGSPYSFVNADVFKTSTAKNLSGLDFFRLYFPHPIPRGRLVARETQFNRTDWTLTTVFRAKELYGDVTFFRIYTLTLGLIATLLTLYVIRKHVVHIANGVLTIQNTIRIEDDQVHFQMGTGNELEYLNRAFVSMKKNIDQLLKEQKEGNVRLLQAQEERRQAEIRAIEAQVNPHFLYNTLNSLNWMAIDHKDTEMSRVITDLADILRYSISRIDTLTTVSEEVDWLGKYLNLQNTRFDDLFDYDIQWDKDIGGFRMYKLLFQPYVENAIIHGFQGLNKKGLISIDLESKVSGGIRISIRDNGKGFNTHRMNKASIGMESSAYRMKLYYGGRANAVCRSEKNRGTEVVLEIPEIDIEAPHR